MSNPTTGDISPEHTARAMNNDLHPEVKAAYAYVDRVSHTTADVQAAPGIHAWHGWALREAFLAGCSHADAPAQPELEGVTDEELEATARAAEVQDMKEQGGLTSPTPDGLSRQLQAQRLAGLRAAQLLARPAIQSVAPTDEELYELWEESGFESDRFARAVLAHWGRPTIKPVSQS